SASEAAVSPSKPAAGEPAMTPAAARPAMTPTIAIAAIPTAPANIRIGSVRITVAVPIVASAVIGIVIGIAGVAVAVIGRHIDLSVRRVCRYRGDGHRRGDKCANR